MALDQPTLEAIATLCERLSERTAVLFLGAGINAGSLDDDGTPCPLGQELSEWICRDLLAAEDLRLTLDEAAEMARFRLGESALNEYLYARLSRFRPTAAHLALVQLPWDVVYTTNFDLLVEAAAKLPSVTPAGAIRPVFSSRTDLSTFSEQDILYYKLHGSIDLAGTEDGRLILAKEDYRHYESHRKPLFKRLERDLLSRTFVFAGYSLRDANFRGILEDCREVLGLKTFPLSFAIRPGCTSVEVAFWREKYNVQLLDSDGVEFLSALKETWIAEGARVVPFEERRARAYAQVDPTTRFQKLGDSFHRLIPSDCTGMSDPRRYFRGGEPTWADIRDQVAPPRDSYWTLLEGMFAELADPAMPPSAFLITGAAGTGKTTLLRSVGYGLAAEFKVPVLIHVPGTPLDARLVAGVVDEKNRQRIVVLVRHGAEYLAALERFLEEARNLGLGVSVIVEERKNQWIAAGTRWRGKSSPAEIELGALSEGEIDRILDALERHKAQGKLTGASPEYQRSHFIALAHKELLVALRELTSDGTFDKIIKDEFEKIPSLTAKRAYLYVSALGQVDLAVRYETLVHVLKVGYAELAEAVFKPAEGILISTEATGGSRHNAGFRVMARHPVIASVIFATAARDDDEKFEVINALLTHLDPGYMEDRRLLNELVRRREFVSAFAGADKRRAIYDRLAVLLPDNPYVHQHRALLERDLGDSAAAIKFAREAVRHERANQAFLNTLGLVLEAAARTTKDELPREALLAEAAKLFDENLKQDPANPYGYIGKVLVIKQRAERAATAEERAVLRASVLSILEEAYETTGESPVIAGELGAARDRFGKETEAIEVLRAGLKRDPTDDRLRDLWIRLEVDRGRVTEALKLALEGVSVLPTSWRLQRHVARAMRMLGGDAEAVKGHYEAAIRHRRGDVGLRVELGAYLFMSGRYSEARVVFSEAKDLPVSSLERNRIREVWRDSDGRDRVFVGRVKSLHGASGWLVAIPENFEAFFWRTRAQVQALRERDEVRFVVGFNAMGPTARVLE